MLNELKAFSFSLTIFGIHTSDEYLAWRLWNAVQIILTIAVIGVYGIVTTYRSAEVVSLSLTVATIVFISQLVTHLVILLESWHKKEAQHKFFAHLQAVEISLQLRLKQNFSRQHLLKHLKHELLIILVVSVVGLTTFIVVVTIIGDEGCFWYGFWTILTMRLRLIQIILCVDIIKDLLRHLNDKLRMLVVERQLLDGNFSSVERVKRLMGIRDSYALIYDAITQLNDSSGWSLFFITGCYIFDFTCHIYWSLLALDRLLPVSSNISSVATMLPMGFSICKLCCVCQCCKRESQIAADLLKKVKIVHTCCKNRCRPIDYAYRNLIFEFLLQLKHQPMEVTARKFFTFDKQFIINICVSIATHFIILIQFLKSDQR